MYYFLDLLFLYIIQLMSIEHAMNKKSQIHNKNI